MSFAVTTRELAIALLDVVVDPGVLTDEITFYPASGAAVDLLENARPIGCIDQIELEVVEREATPKCLMKFRIQLQLARLSLLNTISILEIFGVNVPFNRP